jgi:hypothetical protein
MISFCVSTPPTMLSDTTHVRCKIWWYSALSCHRRMEDLLVVQRSDKLCHMYGRTLYFVAHNPYSVSKSIVQNYISKKSYMYEKTIGLFANNAENSLN